VDPSGNRRGGGSGIGLQVARALVEALGGRIWAESAGPGRGSTFSFTLPVAQKG
jgi:two-component system, OmpR family, sensor histidine kinase BaeS